MDGTGVALSKPIMKTPHCAPRRAAGFTLVELLVVLALMSITMVLVLPSLVRVVQHQRILSAAQQTAILLRLARLEAIKTSSPTVVQANMSNNTLMAYTDSNNNQTLDTGENVLGKLELTKEVRLLPVSGFPGTLANFQSNGAALKVGAFRFQNVNGDQLEVRIMTATSGRVQIQKFQGGAWIANGEGGTAWIWN
jgi:type IV fimbrial biogenesis protein FimT